MLDALPFMLPSALKPDGSREASVDTYLRVVAQTQEATQRAGDLLGVGQALALLPDWNPEGWQRSPEFASAKIYDTNRRWIVSRKYWGDVVELVGLVFGDRDRLAAAERIIAEFDGWSEDERALLRPDYNPQQAPGARPDDLCPAVSSSLLPVIEDAADFLAKDLPRPAELVHGILHQGSKMILAGSSKVGKTWLALDLGLSVAHGREWLGFSTQQGAVLYLNLEIQPAFFGDRLRTVAEAKSIVIEPGHLSFMNLRGHAADLSKLLPELLTTIGTKKYALIIVDPIYKVLGGRDENDAGQIAELVNDLERLVVGTGAAVVFAAHYSKGNQAAKSSIDRVSGSGVFARDPDTILTLTSHAEADAYTVEATLRNHPPLEPFVVRWKYPLMERDDNLNPGKLKQTTGRPKTHTAEDLLKVLGGRELSFNAWKAAAKVAGISETTFKKLREELVKTGRVRQCEEEGTYRKTGQGGKV